mgnify:CR=1 FL=1
MGNPFCPKCGRLLMVKKSSGTRYWICSKGHKFKTGETSLDHQEYVKEGTSEALNDVMRKLLARITLKRR